MRKRIVRNFIPRLIAVPTRFWPMLQHAYVTWKRLFLCQPKSYGLVNRITAREYRNSSYDIRQLRDSNRSTIEFVFNYTQIQFLLLFESSRRYLIDRCYKLSLEEIN